MEDIINYIDGKVQVIFERGEQPLSYRDAIWMSESEYAATTRESIITIQDKRYTDWLALVNNIQSISEQVVE